MGRTITHQGYTIHSAPRRLTAWDKWQLCVFISWDHERGVDKREFTSAVLYTTEQEADVHGIAYAQRLIDGKIAGQSVAALKPPDRRSTPRFRVSFRGTFTVSHTLEGSGVLLDLSAGGCRIESSDVLQPGYSLELRIHIPDMDWPIKVEQASVQWVSGSTFGLAFFLISPAERERLDQVITKLQPSPLESENR